jgi:hypothetical protein
LKRKINYILNQYWEFLLFSVLLTVLVVSCADHIFFWDTVQLGARHATFYYDNGLSFEFLPNRIDSGHIPSFGYLLAVCWTLFGKSLLVSHLFVLPFAIGIAWQAHRFLNHFISKKNLIWAMLLLFLDTTFLSQVSLVSPDIPLLFFFLFALNSILTNKRVSVAVAFSLLFLVSMRGMILTVPLFLFDVYLHSNFSFKKIKTSLITIVKLGIPYLPAASIFISFSWFHFTQKGWIGYHEDSPWAIFFQRVGFSGAIKNTAVFGWRLLDFGRVFIWLIGFACLVWIWRKKLKFSNKAKQLSVLFLLIIAFLSIPAIIYYDLKGHRYFMPIYFSVTFLVSYLFLEVVKNKLFQKASLFIGLIGLISGSFWVYPSHIAQGWDSTLGHLSYYQLRDNMIQFMDEYSIDKSQVGFDFPGGYEQRFLDLSEETWFFPEVDIENQEYILFSNVVNEFSDEELIELKENWKLIHQEKSITVNFVLYHRGQ